MADERAEPIVLWCRTCQQGYSYSGGPVPPACTNDSCKSPTPQWTVNSPTPRVPYVITENDYNLFLRKIGIAR